MSRPVISAMGHVALQVRDLDASTRVATEILGLTVRERREGAVDLTHSSPHHSLQYILGDVDGLDHVGLEAPDLEALAEVRSRVDAAGLRIVSEVPLDDCLSDGFAFEGPQGFVFEVYRGMPQEPVSYKPVGVRPNRFGHVTFAVTDKEEMRAFLSDVLDFRISDIVSAGYFMRCNVDHHGIAFTTGARPALHHHGWEVQTTVEVGLLADRVNEDGGSVLWGPVRHGCGRNIATYFQDPGGSVIEYYSDMDRYYDDDFVPPVWDETDHKWYSLWSPMIPDPWVDLGVPPLARTTVTT